MIEEKQYKHCCVIDTDGCYVTFVLVLPATTIDGGNSWEVQNYMLQEGETLLEAPAPHELTRPHWTGVAWEETAMPEEIAAAEAERAAMSPFRTLAK